MTEDELRRVIVEHWRWYQAQFIPVDPADVGDRDLIAAFIQATARRWQRGALRLRSGRP